jgi:Protein of unknwon function (DUF3310).
MKIFKGDDSIHPDYYHRGGIDVIKFAELHFPREQVKGFHRINILKYVTRYDRKGGVEDLRKAEEYLRRLIEMEERSE